MHSGRIGGVALIVGALGAVGTMVIHPVGGHLGESPDALRAAADMTRLAHGIALVSMPLMLFGYADFARRLGLARASALGGLVFQAFAVMAVLSAALMSGPVMGELLERAADPGRYGAAAVESQMRYTFVLNQAYAAVYTLASAAAVGAWSMGLWAVGRLRGLAMLGAVVAVGQPALLAFAGDDALSVHGFMIIVAAQAAWAIGIGLALWRDWAADA